MDANVNFRVLAVGRRQGAVNEAGADEKMLGDVKLAHGARRLQENAAAPFGRHVLDQVHTMLPAAANRDADVLCVKGEALQVKVLRKVGRRFDAPANHRVAGDGGYIAATHCRFLRRGCAVKKERVRW